MKFSGTTACILLLPGTAVVASEGPNRKDDVAKWTFQAGAVHQFNSSLDSGGDMSASRWFRSRRRRTGVFTPLAG